MKLAITTLSLIRTSKERKVVFSTIAELSKLQIPIVIVDGGSSEQDKKEISSFPNVKLFETDKGLMDQLILSHKEAIKMAEYIFYLHSDKFSFVKNNCQKMIDFYGRLENKGMLIPVRSKRSFKTYPPYQRRVERFLNFFMSDYIGTASDYYTGPKIYPASLVTYLKQLQGDIGWGIEAYFYVIAKRLGLPFNFINCEMSAPKDIENEEVMKFYRLQIANWQIEGLIQGLKTKLS